MDREKFCYLFRLAFDSSDSIEAFVCAHSDIATPAQLRKIYSASKLSVDGLMCSAGYFTNISMCKDLNLHRNTPVKWKREHFIPYHMRLLIVMAYDITKIKLTSGESET